MGTKGQAITSLSEMTPSQVQALTEFVEKYDRDKLLSKIRKDVANTTPEAAAAPKVVTKAHLNQLTSTASARGIAYNVLAPYILTRYSIENPAQMPDDWAVALKGEIERAAPETLTGMFGAAPAEAAA